MDPDADWYGETVEFTGGEKKNQNKQSKAAKKEQRKQNKKDAKKGIVSTAKNNNGNAYLVDEHTAVHCDELYIWLIDSYRMRCHDDLQWRGGVRRSIYESMRVERRLRPLNENGKLEKIKLGWNGEKSADDRPFPSSLSVAKDFFLFLKLVELREKFPPR